MDVPMPAEAGPARDLAARSTARQTGDTARSIADDADIGTVPHAGARNGNAAATPTPQAAAPAAAAAQPGDVSAPVGDSPDILLSASTGDGDPTSGPAGQPLAGTPSAPAAQAAHGAMGAGGHRPAATPPMLADQIAVHIHKGVQQGAGRIEIQLSPAELGRIEVRLELGHDGRVHAAIAADRPDTLDLLQRDARGLERALQDAGLKTDSGGLSFNLRDNGRQQSQAGFTTHPSFTDNRSERSEPGVVADAGGHRVRLDGVLDIRV
jgi:flagellar hook-length control protein FliK